MRSAELFSDDADLELRRYLRVQSNVDRRLTEGLDGFIQMDAAAIGANALFVQEVRDVLRRHGPEQLALFRSLTALLEGQRFDATPQQLGVGLEAIRLRLLLRLDVVEVVQIALRRAQ